MLDHHLLLVVMLGLNLSLLLGLLLSLLVSLSLLLLLLSLLLSLGLSLSLLLFIRLLRMSPRLLHHRCRRRRRFLNGLLAWHRPDQVRRGPHLAHARIHARFAHDLCQDAQALLLSRHVALQLEDPVQTRPDAIGLAVIRAVVDLGC